MGKPFAGWDDETIKDERLVWLARFDNRFQIEVQRTAEFSADLVIYDHDNCDRELLRENVQLSYGAAFGPDADDIFDWKQRVVRFVDEEFGK